MLVHAPDENVLLDFFVAVPGQGRDRAALRAGSRFPSTSARTFRRSSTSARPRAGCPGTAAGLWEALRRFGSMPMAELVRPAVAHAREGVPVNAEQAFIFKILEPILTHQPEGRAIYAPEGRQAPRGRRVPVRGARATRSSATGPRAPSPSTGASSRERSRSGWWSAAGPWASRTWPPTSRSRVSGARALPRPRRAHQPAALVGRHPDRLRPRPARPARRRRGRGGGGGDGGGAGRPHRGVPRRALRGRLAGAVPRPGAPRRGRRARPVSPAPARRRGRGAGRSPRLDHPHHGRRRRRALRQRHLLERHRLGPDRPRAPASTSTTCSARRTSTRSASTPCRPGGACPR